jgi:hypothetical protein
VRKHDWLCRWRRRAATAGRLPGFVQAGRRIAAACVVAALSLPAFSCTILRSNATDSLQRAYVAADDGSVLARYAPIFVLQTDQEPYNRIGTVAARHGATGDEEIYVDTSVPTFYAQKEEFKTASESYTDLIYRAHFDRTPLPFLSAGRNVAVIAVVTLNASGQPVLLTFTHACGGYVIFVPTSYLPDKALPEGWATAGQSVYGEDLPGRLAFPEAFDNAYRPVVVLRDATHGAMAVRVEDVREAAWRYQAVAAKIEPMASLEALPLDAGTTSLYAASGSQRGLVKGGLRPLRLLLTSWWMLDLHAGRDRKFTNAHETGKTFYTSLKFWNREESDMWEFANFLQFWGWRL